ncbi:MAG TPA: acyl carrier protein [Candidatus Acidoferrum sp.]|nr:acyl carrier protein [Candidatus Acidoferrum sp.]
MSGRKAIEETLHDFVVNELLDGEADGLTATTNLLALGIIDSLAVVSLRIFVERAFGVHLPDGLQPEDFTTLSAIAALVERLQRTADAEPSTAA